MAKKRISLRRILFLAGGTRGKKHLGETLICSCVGLGDVFCSGQTAHLLFLVFTTAYVF